MVKRPSYSTSDSADDHASSSKRAKTADSDEDDEGPQIHMPHHLRSNGIARNARRDREDNDNDDDGEEPLDEDQNAEIFENQHREKILANLAEKRKVYGVRLFFVHPLSRLTSLKGIAEHGIIESIEMHSFMCHKYLTFDFGPQINFIIGTRLTSTFSPFIFIYTQRLGHNGSE